MGVPACEREVDLTELYIADEVFACGTSTYIAPVIEVDARAVTPRARPLAGPWRGRRVLAVRHAFGLRGAPLGCAAGPPRRRVAELRRVAESHPASLRSAGR